MRKLNTGGEWYEIDVARFQRVRSQIRSLHQNLVNDVQRTKQRTMQSALLFFCPFSPLFSKFQSEKNNFEYNFINAIDYPFPIWYTQKALKGADLRLIIINQIFRRGGYFAHAKATERSLCIEERYSRIAEAVITRRSCKERSNGIASGRKYLKSRTISASVKLVWVQAHKE